MIKIKKVSQDDLPELAKLLEELSEKKTDTEKMTYNFNCIARNKDYIVLGQCMMEIL